MTVDESNVRGGLTGAISKAPYGSTAPTSGSSALDAAFIDSGGISEDGVTLTLPDGGDRNVVKFWQNGAQARVFRSPSTDLPSLQFTFLETNLTTVETYFEATVDDTDGSLEFNVDIPTPKAYVLDVVDGSSTHRYYVPRGVKASVGDLVYKNAEPVGYQVTIECEKDSTAGFNFKRWDSDLIVP